MGRKKIDQDKRRTAIGISLPQELIMALSVYSDISGLSRSTIIERAILLYLAQVKNGKSDKHLWNAVYGKMVQEEVKKHAEVSC